MPFTRWILDENHQPIPVGNSLEWVLFNDDLSKRRVAETDVTPEVRVSTVFLGLDHNYKGTGAPILFETMVFGNIEDGQSDYQRRYETREEAEIGHEATVGWLRHKLNVPPPEPPPEPDRPIAPTWHERLVTDEDDD